MTERRCSAWVPELTVEATSSQGYVQLAVVRKHVQNLRLLTICPAHSITTHHGRTTQTQFQGYLTLLPLPECCLWYAVCGRCTHKKSHCVICCTLISTQGLQCPALTDQHCIQYQTDVGSMQDIKLNTCVCAARDAMSGTSTFPVSIIRESGSQGWGETRNAKMLAATCWVSYDY